MKKIGILTFHDSDNFGSVLQAYATCRMLRNAGHMSRVIDFRKPEVVKLYSILKPLTNKTNLAVNVYSGLHYAALAKRKKRFEQFRRVNLHMTDRLFSDGQSLAELDDDAYIVGSDQVWNMDIVDFDRAYLLPFAGNARRIACAASFGPKNKQMDAVATMVPDLTAFDLITVREEMAADLLEQAGLPRPAVVPDPVFFLTPEEWDQVAAPPTKRKPYMLCYFPGVVTEEFEKETCRIARERNLERVLLMPHWRNFFRKGERAYDAGPAQFLRLIRDAEMVCTNSFHAAAFSVIYNKDFLVGTNEVGSDARINTLLRAVGMEHREFGVGAAFAGRSDGSLEQSAKACQQAILQTIEME